MRPNYIFGLFRKRLYRTMNYVENMSIRFSKKIANRENFGTVQLLKNFYLYYSTFFFIFFFDNSSAYGLDSLNLKFSLISFIILATDASKQEKLFYGHPEFVARIFEGER